MAHTYLLPAYVPNRENEKVEGIKNHSMLSGTALLLFGAVAGSATVSDIESDLQAIISEAVSVFPTSLDMTNLALFF